MRFLMLNWRDPFSPLSGGAERVTHAHLAELARRGNEVFWFANAFPGCKPADALDGVQIVRGGGKFTSIFAARRWYREQARFDLVIDQHHGIPWFAPWWCGTNCLAYIHEVLGPIWGSFYPWPVSTLGRWQEQGTHWLYRHVPFWTVSESTAVALRATGVRRVNVWPNGIDTVALDRPVEKSIAEPWRLICVSRLAPNKRIDHCLRALKTLLDSGARATLTIVGTGECEEELKQLAQSLGIAVQVEFTGKLNEAEKDRRLRDAHLLLHASLREGWGLNVTEANAMATPAVVYPVGGLVDSTVHGETGVVVTAETPAALAAGVRAALRGEAAYQAMCVKALERARSLHWSRVLPATCDWLESLAQGNR
jgi:glycosyltransferase involved in cell wall biosynthesis